MPWQSASIPVAAVIAGGRLRLNSGSQIATGGTNLMLTHAALAPPSRVSEAARPTSAPVPAVVGMATIGATWPIASDPPAWIV